MEQIATKRTTLYRMIEGCTFETALTEPRGKNNDSFEVIDFEIESYPARLVSGAISTPTKWVSDIKALTGKDIKLSNCSPGAILLLLDKAETVWAITWGIGFHFIDSEQIDFRFGTRVVARSAIPSEIKSLTKTILDHRARVDRSSLPNGSTVRDLGVDGYGEVVSRIESKAIIPDLSTGDKIIQLRAADSLNLPLARDPHSLINDLAALDNLLKSTVKIGLESLEQLISLKPRDQKVSALNSRLVEALKNERSRNLGISWPHERLDISAPIMSVKIVGFGDRNPRILEEFPEVSNVIEWFSAIRYENVIDRLKTIKVELHSEASPEKGTLASNPVPLWRWLAFEVEEKGLRFCLHDGSWYRMDDQYLSRIDERVYEILNKPELVTLPPWDNQDEAKYNELLAKELSGYCLDRKLITTPLHSRGGIEPCDVFVPPGTLIHVKRGRKSADLSHLLAQGLVSADAISRDENARKAWCERIAEESSGQVTNASLEKVILVIGSDKRVTIENLFTFTKVNLVKQYDALRYLGVDVRLETALPSTS